MSGAWGREDVGSFGCVEDAIMFAWRGVWNDGVHGGLHRDREDCIEGCSEGCA